MKYLLLHEHGTGCAVPIHWHAIASMYPIACDAEIVEEEGTAVLLNDGSTIEVREPAYDIAEATVELCNQPSGIYTLEYEEGECDDDGELNIDIGE